MGEGTPERTPEESLDPDISDEDWQAEVAQREGELRPTDDEFGPCKLPTPHAKHTDKHPRAPRPGVSTNPAMIDARIAVKMGQRAAGGTTLDAAVLLLRAAADPASTVRMELPDGTVLETAKLSPNRAKGVFTGECGKEHPFEDIGISFDAWGKWLAANGHVGFQPGTAAWRQPVAGEAAAAAARPERRTIERMDRRAAKTPLAHKMKQIVDAPPDWVWLTPAMLILRRRFGVGFTTWVTDLRCDIRKWQLQHRVAELRLADVYAGANDVIWGNTRIPGLAYSSEERNVIVDDWDAAKVDWIAGTVGGVRLHGGGRRRHRIELWWLDLEQWAKARLKAQREAATTIGARAARVTVAGEAPAKPPAVHVASDAPTPVGAVKPAKAGAKKPPFDTRKAKALLAAKKLGGDWASPPTENDSRLFLLAHFNGVSNDPHRRIRREIWRGQIKTGPRPKRRTAE